MKVVERSTFGLGCTVEGEYQLGDCEVHRVKQGVLGRVLVDIWEELVKLPSLHSATLG